MCFPVSSSRGCRCLTWLTLDANKRASERENTSPANPHDLFPFFVCAISEPCQETLWKPHWDTYGALREGEGSPSWGRQSKNQTENGKPAFRNRDRSSTNSTLSRILRHLDAGTNPRKRVTGTEEGKVGKSRRSFDIRSTRSSVGITLDLICDL